MTENENKVLETEHEEPERHAVKDVPSKQDKSWVGDDQMPQQQFDKAEYEDEEGNGLERKCGK